MFTYNPSQTRSFDIHILSRIVNDGEQRKVFDDIEHESCTAKIEMMI